VAKFGKLKFHEKINFTDARVIKKRNVKYGVGMCVLIQLSY